MAASFALATMTVQAQAPQTPPNPQAGAPQTAPPRAPTVPPSTTAPAPAEQAARAATDQMLTITGCLKEEKDVPGRKPGVTERAGIAEDYFLTDVKAAAGSNVSALGLGTTYEIEGIDSSELKKHLNHQVELQGKIATAVTGGAKTDSGVPEFNATSIKMLAATCPAAK